MNRLKSVFTKRKKYAIAGLAVIVILTIIFLSRSRAEGEVFTVAKADVVQSVVLSGEVQTSDRADLGFASSGRLQKVFVKNNQSVNRGQTLAQLEIGDLLADLKIKEANLRTSNVDLEAAKEELERVTKQEDTKVESAYRTLLSEDLLLIPKSNDYGVTAPIVNGIYDGPEGKYEVTIDKESVTSLNSRLRTFNLERTTQKINEEGSTPLGTKGLYISFPDDVFASYNDTTWFLDIPNKASASYLSNYNAYNEAKKARDLAIQEAQFKYKKLLTEGDSNNYTVAQAEISKINAEIRKNTIHAPFAGIVTNIEKEVGENASVGERVISILGEDKLEVVLQVSELDVSRLAPQASVKITLDAFPGEEFVGTLQTVNSRDTEIEGVPVYEAFIELKPDPRIKTGMSANGTVVVAAKNEVLAIPNYYVTKSGDKNFVQVVSVEGEAAEREVVLGLLGTDSMAEVISGLAEGEKIVSSAKK